jgi:catechol 2,3-dioxygenase-like lactoylglutathione lyase family enzyme
MRILAIDHIVLRCRDAVAMERFYVDVLGCSVEKRRADLGLVHLRAGSGLIDLVDIGGALGRGGAAPDPDAHNVDHLCLRLESFDAAGLERHLAAFGIARGEVHSNYGAEGIGPSIYVTDPEGNVVELKGPATRSASHQ